MAQISQPDFSINLENFNSKILKEDVTVAQTIIDKALSELSSPVFENIFLRKIRSPSSFYSERCCDEGIACTCQDEDLNKVLMHEDSEAFNMNHTSCQRDADKDNISNSSAITSRTQSRSKSPQT